MEEKKTFASLAIGAIFRFESEVSMPFSGMAHGPWVKCSTRTYVRLGDNPQARHRVGTVKVMVLVERE
jgi:hypothetical protein